MIEYNCALYLSQYLNDKKINVKNSTTNKNALLMIETRPSLSIVSQLCVYPMNCFDSHYSAFLAIVQPNRARELTIRARVFCE